MSDDSDDHGSSSSEEEDQLSSWIKVSIRLRPMNKFEESRRSKNCVELHDNPRIITVDSPLDGEYDFRFERVFDECASQAEVFEHAVSPMVAKLLEGYNCAVMAYGQTGTGKTHTMLGASGWVGTGDKGACEESSRSGIRSIGDQQDEGMITRTVKALFSQMEKSSPLVEYTLRCSYVEIYLEKILDLLKPHGAGDAPINIVEDDTPEEANGLGCARLVGASELCCINEADVVSLLERGNAGRTVSSTNMNTDSSRSHAMFMLNVVQRNVESGETKASILQMFDLAGSEMAGNTPQYAVQQQNVGTSAVQAEAKMINRSLSSLTHLVRAQMKQQKGEPVEMPSAYKHYKLTRLLRPCFGGNCLTAVILTASASSYNIGETISSIRFGQCCRQIKNPAMVITDYTPAFYKKRLVRSERKQSELKKLVRALAEECKNLKNEGMKGQISEGAYSGPLWDSITELLSEVDESEADYVVVVKRGTANEAGPNGDVSLQLGRDTSLLDNDADDEIAQLQSEVAVLRSQNEELGAENKKVVQELIDAKNEIQVISQRKIEVEHNLRTSLFRENEATVFLRQFRRFYRRLLKQKAAQGTGSTENITKETKGVPDLNDLIDVDTLLVESGLIEEDEMHDDTAASTYRPSSAALLRSTSAAKKAAQTASNLERDTSGTAFTSSVHSETSDDDGSSHVTSSSANESDSRIGATTALSLGMISETEDDEPRQHPVDANMSNNEQAEDSASRAADADETEGVQMDSFEGSESMRSSDRMVSGAAIADQQRKLRSPAGRLLAAKEKELESDFMKMTERCIQLQLELDEERAKLEAATNRSGTFGKKRDAQEVIDLRQQLEKKTHDLQAIIWKMNELHLINKTYYDKMENRKQHVNYLEENLSDLQNTNRRLMREREESERKLREELSNLKTLVDGATVPLWQFGEEGTSERPMPSRLVIPVIHRNPDWERRAPGRRFSEGASETSLEPDDGDNQGTSSPGKVPESKLGLLETRARASNVDAQTQTEALSENAVDLSREADAIEAPTCPTQTVNVHIQTDGTDTIDAAIQTDKEPNHSIEQKGYPQIDRSSCSGPLENFKDDKKVNDHPSLGVPNEPYAPKNKPSDEGAKSARAFKDHNGYCGDRGASDDSSDEEALIKSAAKAFACGERSSSEEEYLIRQNRPNGKFDKAPVSISPTPDRNLEKKIERRSIGSHAIQDGPFNRFFEGGKPADFVPRVYVEKSGANIRSGVLKDNRRRLAREESRRSRRSSKKSGSADGKKKKKKKSSRDISNKKTRSTSQTRRETRSGGRSKRSKSVF